MSPFLLKGKTGVVASLATYFISYAAVASSSATNTYAMRMNEIATGVTVKDEASGEDFGLSKVAAASGVLKTCASRIVYVFPVFLVPAIWNTVLSKARLMPKSLGVTRILLESLGVALGLYISMPINCALFPQMSRIAVSDLEPEIQAKAKARNLTYLTYNKGL